MSVLQKKRSGDDGASAVEFALVLPILVLLIVGIVQFGFLFMEWLQIEHAAREGARWAALDHPYTGSSTDTRTVEYKVRLAAQDLDGSLEISISPTYEQRRYGEPVIVTVRCEVPVFTAQMGELLEATPTVPLSSTAAQMFEGAE